MKAIGCVPKIKTSFDGVGHHDWLRNHKGEEKITLDAIKLCVENGFPVMVHTNVHRLNKESMLETAKVLDSLGVCEMRIIRTCESPRWAENAGDNCLTTEEYYDEMLKFSALYSKTDCEMHISIWHFADIYPRAKRFGARTIGCEEGQYLTSRNSVAGDPIFANSFCVVRDNSIPGNYIPVCLAAGGPAVNLNDNRSYGYGENDALVYLYFRSDRASDDTDDTVYISGLAEVMLTDRCTGYDISEDDLFAYAKKIGYTPLSQTKKKEHDGNIFYDEDISRFMIYGIRYMYM